VSPETALRREDGSYHTRILAPGAYAFVIECDGPSIQLGELSEIRNGDTGARQLVGCSTQAPVRGAIADRVDRSELVDLVINPIGLHRWRLLVIDGAGSTGPFEEP
jgi:hypothetical protein